MNTSRYTFDFSVYEFPCQLHYYLYVLVNFKSRTIVGETNELKLLQVGKGRDVGLNQIALFEGKVAGGNGEQVLSRDVYRLGQLFDFFRMMSFYFTTVGYYFCTMVSQQFCITWFLLLVVCLFLFVGLCRIWYLAYFWYTWSAIYIICC